ncbi:MAG: gluconokinase [Rubrivivax sp.]|jgi:gluconokinase|nr:gluconokinase [Rubrivivax sp.]
MSPPTVLRLVVMGVSGCGKSTLAGALGEALHLCMTDGDDLHLPDSVRKMQSGVPLTDADRWPWLDRVAACLQAAPDASAPAGRVVACSALKRVYRDRLRQHLPDIRFVFLDGQPELLRQRMGQRTGHFMQLQMLESQLNTLERPAGDEHDVLTLQADQPLAHQVAQVTLAASAWTLHPTGARAPELP